MNVTVNGVLREFPDGMNALDIAGELDRELKKTALAARVNGTVQDLAKPVPDGSQLEILTADDPDGLRVLRHIAVDSLQRLILGHDGLQGLVGSDAGQNLTFQMELFFFRRVQMH